MVDPVANEATYVKLENAIKYTTSGRFGEKIEVNVVDREGKEQKIKYKENEKDFCENLANIFIKKGC